MRERGVHLTSGKLRSRQTSAHLIGVVALVFALGNRSRVGECSEEQRQLEKVKNGTLRGVDIRNNSLTGADIKKTTLNGSAIPGATGPQGPQGPLGGGISGASNLFFNAVGGRGATTLYNANGTGDPGDLRRRDRYQPRR